MYLRMLKIRRCIFGEVTSWHTKSCWCLKSITSRNNLISHWMTWTKIYSVYRWIKCEWGTFEDFYKDMWPTYQEWLSIERVNNNWNYCRENCIWAGIDVQNNNTRNTVRYKWKPLTTVLKDNWMSRNRFDYLRYKKKLSLEQIFW